MWYEPRLLTYLVETSNQHMSIVLAKQSRILTEAKRPVSLSLGVSAVKTNWVWDWDSLICQDQILKLVNIILTRFFFSVEVFKIETFESRLSCVKIFIEIVEINQDFWDFWDLLRLFEIYQDISTLLRLFEGLQV